MFGALLQIILIFYVGVIVYYGKNAPATRGLFLVA